MHKAFVSVGALIAAFAFTGTAGAATLAASNPGSNPGSVQPAFHRAGSHWRRHRAEAWFRQLDLTPAQRASIHGFAKAGFQQLRPELLALRQNRAAFNRAVPGSAAYQAAANDLAHAEANAALARALRRADLRSQAYRILTPAQRTQLATLQAQRRERRDWRREHLQSVTSAATTG